MAKNSRKRPGRAALVNAFAITKKKKKKKKRYDLKEIGLFRAVATLPHHHFHLFRFSSFPYSSHLKLPPSSTPSCWLVSFSFSYSWKTLNVLSIQIPYGPRKTESQHYGSEQLNHIKVNSRKIGCVSRPHCACPPDKVRLSIGQKNTCHGTNFISSNGSNQIPEISIPSEVGRPKSWRILLLVIRCALGLGWIIVALRAWPHGRTHVHR